MRTRRAVVERHLTDEALRDAIKKADDRKIVRRLCIVSNLYAGDTIEEAACRVGASQSIGSQWLERWNEDGPRGLVPRFGGGRPPKLSHQQSRDLQRLLEEGQPWTTSEITRLIEDEFGVSYHSGHVGRMCRTVYGMSYAIPRPETPSRPENAEEILAERLTKAFGEESDEEAVDPGETVLRFFRGVVADADRESASALGIRYATHRETHAASEDDNRGILRNQRHERAQISREPPQRADRGSVRSDP